MTMMRLKRSRFTKVKPAMAETARLRNLKDEMESLILTSRPKVTYYFQIARQVLHPVFRYWAAWLVSGILVIGFALLLTHSNPPMPPDEMTGRLLNLMNMTSLMFFVFALDIIWYHHKLPIFR